MVPVLSAWLQRIRRADKMKKILVCLTLVYSLLLFGCPSKSIQKAKESSAKLATYANAGVDVTRGLFRENVITLAQKDKIADAFIVLADAGIAFDAAVRKAETEYGTNAPKAEIDRLFAIFDAEVVAKFLGVLSALKLVNDIGSFSVVIETLKTSVLLIAKAFGRMKQTEARLAI
jgi:hypothetical protein